MDRQAENNRALPTFVGGALIKNYYSTKTYVVDTQKNCVNKMVLLKFEHPKQIVNRTLVSV